MDEMFQWDELSKDSSGKTLLLYRHQRVLDEGVVTAGMRVLDVGGWGAFASRLMEEGVDCTIMDNFSEDQYYPERVRSLPHIAGDILDVEMLSQLGKFDVVSCFEMLEHCLDQKAAIVNIYDLLVDGGTLVGTFPIPGHSHAVGDPDVNFLTEDELNCLFKECGFVVQSLEPTASIFPGDTPCSFYFKCQKKGI